MKRIGSYLVSAVLIVLCVAVSVAPASVAAAGNSSGLSITPRKNYTINAGQSITDKLTVGNLNSSEDLNITLKAIDFTFMNESGVPKLMLADNAPQTTWSLKPFISLPKAFVVPGGQTRTINFTIKIPKNQGAGSYYSAINYAATGPTGNNVSLSASGVTLAFVSVPGVVKESLTLKKMGAYQPNGGDASGKYVYIATSAPQQIAYTLKNAGNVAESPAGSIVITPQFFGKKVTIDNINANSSLALIGQSRLFTACIQKEDKVVTLGTSKTVSTVCSKKPHLTPGRYTVTLDAFYGQNGNKSQEILGTAHFWYLPGWFILAVLVIIAIIGFAIWWLVRKIRRAVNGNSSKNRSFRRR